MGHMSEDRKKERVASTAWWPQWKQELNEYINTCERCQKANRKHGKKYGLLKHREEPKHPWETINMDWVKPTTHKQMVLLKGQSKQWRTSLEDSVHMEWNTKTMKGTLLLAIQLANNTSLHLTTSKSPSLAEKGWNSLLPVDHLKKNPLTIHPTPKDFHYMWKKAFDPAARCIAQEKEYNTKRYYKTHKEPYFKEGNQVLVSTLNFDNLKVPKKMRDTFVGPFTIIILIRKNAAEVQLTEYFFRKHPVFLKQKPYSQDIVEVEDSPGPVKKIIKARKIRLDGKYCRQYLIRFKSQTAYEDKWLAEDAIPYGDLHLRRLRTSRSDKKSHK
ncbi:hypothetical protein O181_032276 [Austropuccinia psidii MF-1]|uniref:Integrase zinc-binding domain-containing protein n=1 Tax=Austropuccinia psidii MF-1 TaxID=1389203 RepID=A0A9Q3D243_9BASI|nr:hypothetical protein [Austropuccinia psidii MF-1]